MPRGHRQSEGAIVGARLLDLPKKGKYPFEYRNAAQTDIRLTWAKERERLEAEAAGCRESAQHQAGETLI
jgi:hypothetical protein